MKKVLILAYDFPPYVSVGGLRPYSWYKYFHEFGIFPIVVTRQWGNKYGNHLDYIAPGESTETIVEETEFGTIIRTPYKPNLSNRLLLKHGESKFRILRKIISAYYEFAQWLFIIGSKKELYFAAQEYLKKHNVDFIIATGEPFILFKYASKLSEKYKVPWIADYRDTWSQYNSRNSNFIMSYWNKYNECKFVKTAESVFTVSNFLVKQISKLIKNKPFFIVKNGFDNEMIKLVDSIQQNNVELTISFAGTIYPWHPWKSVLKVCSEFQPKDLSPKVCFYGINNQEEIRDYLKTLNESFAKRVTIFPKIPNELLLIELSKSNVLLLFNDYSLLGTKIFDYLLVKRRILLCFSNDLDALNLKQKFFCNEEMNDESKELQSELILETNSGIIVENNEHLKEVLIDLHDEFKDKGLISCNSKGIEKYSRREQAKNLVKQIEKLVMNKNNSNPY